MSVSDPTVVFAWATPSSQGTTTYETVLKRDGAMSCSCPGWVFARKGAERICKHIREYAGEAATIMSRILAGHQVDWDRVPSALTVTLIPQHVVVQGKGKKAPAARADAASAAAILQNRRAISFEE